ncbi:GAF domain-containing protein [Brasilonema sp. UFV-L1]|uniref:GAF domain-containing protein n=1 Tax=Brasilonema sp. UFV-L1 TaxID=2234130 RepID=UPI00145F2226|nr:GAF domain-containing protein [Brasilonema sp. UFV-L1]NMG06851.1 GAF domain-containing protein [Brasilonema sp. UFV-L1]
MVFWKNNTDLPKSYRGWNILMDHEQNCTEAERTDSAKKVLKWVQDYMSVDTVTLLVPIDQQNLAVYATIGLEEEIEQQIRIPIGQGIAGQIAAKMEPMIVNDLSQVEIFSHILRQKNLRSLLGIPLPLEQGIVGVLHVGKFQSHQFGEQDVQQLQIIAHQLGMMITNPELLNFGWGYNNQERSLEVFGFRTHASYLKTIHRIFTFHLCSFGAKLLTKAGFAEIREYSGRQKHNIKTVFSSECV